MKSMRSFDFDKGFGLFCVALAAAFGYASYTMEETAAFQQIGPRLWPAVLSVALAIVGAVILWGGAGSHSASLENVAAEEDGGPAGAAWIVFAAILLTIPVMILLGFWPAGSFLMAVVLFLKETREHIVRSVICAIAVPGGVYYLFTAVFNQYLPGGILFQ